MHEYFSYNFRPVITGDTKPLLKRSDAVVAVKKWLKPERVKFARGEP
ncbi:hypothetical protein QIG49_00125 [Klebsiella pneumoniae]|nr:hypothetical protein [Klebsiella pneumoniae]